MPDDLPDPAPATTSPDGEAASPAGGARAAARPKRKARPKKRHTVAKVIVGTLVTIALVAGLGVVYAYRTLSGNLTVEDVSAQLTDRPEEVEVEGPKKPLNILVMGSDTREGEGNNIDGLTGAGARSDTTILLHISADRSRAYGISIPRDSIVDRPECNGGEVPAASYVQWNEAFTLGGQACTIQQFEQTTGVRVNHYVVLDFAGFRGMVDAIDGVEVCIPETIDDRAHGIYLEAGTRELEGYQALNYVRQRYAVGDGSDLGRLKRQQAFIASMANKIVSAGTLSRPDRVYRLLSSVTESLTVDPGLSNISKLASLGLDFQGVGLDNVQFLTVPWMYDPDDPNRVVWRPEAEELWEKVRNDEALGREFSTQAISAAAVPGAGTGSDGGPGLEDPSGEGSTVSERQRERLEAARLEAEQAGLCV